MDKKVWDKDMVTSAALLAGHQLKAWMKGPQLGRWKWSSSPSKEQAGWAQALTGRQSWL